jgi:hypothetical protein
MVRAILEGRKTQTRRVVKWPVRSQSDGSKRRLWTPDFAAGLNEAILALADGAAKHPCQRPTLPYGALGDRLWVRETFAFRPRNPRTLDIDDVLYREDWVSCPDVPPIWKPSIFMPRWASRLTLEIASVRVERLQKISEADARAEGVFVLKNGAPCVARTGFAVGWDAINGKRAPWASNPWVFVIEFRRLP